MDINILTRGQESDVKGDSSRIDAVEMWFWKYINNCNIYKVR